MATADLLWRQGLHGTGVQQIIEASGAPRGSLYFHFPGGKEELALEALQRAATFITHAIEQLFEGSASVADAVRSFVSMFSKQMVDSEFQRGCPIATVTLEATPESEAMRRVCEAAYDDWERLVASRLVGEGFPRGRARKLATLILASVEGALLLARARQNVEPLDSVARVLAPVLEARQ